MKRKHRSSSRPAQAIALDHGPAIRLARGEVMVPEKPRADPDNPNRSIMGAEVVCGYDRLWAFGLLTDDQREAADRLERALAAIQGGKEGGADFSGVRLAPWQKGHPAARQIQAAADLATARAWLGLGGYENTVSVVGANVWPWEWGSIPLDRKGVPDWSALPGSSISHLRTCLKILVSVWRIDA